MKVQFNPENLSEANTIHQALKYWQRAQVSISKSSHATEEERGSAAQEIRNVGNILDRSVSDG